MVRDSHIIVTKEEKDLEEEEEEATSITMILKIKIKERFIKTLHSQTV